MTTRGTYLIAMLVLLFLANVCMLMGFTNWPQRSMEGFAAAFLKSGSYANTKAEGMDNYGSYTGLKWGDREGFANMLEKGTGAGAAFATAAIGSYDGINLAAGLPPAAQGFRANHPNEPLDGPPVVIDNDHLFMFTNNQCKPECCDSTFSCDGGCVCTTPDQRNLINTRGGNRLIGGSDF
jgi:hypothetical protein